MKGHDIYRAECDLYELMEYVKKNQISIYDIRNDSLIVFSSTFNFRKKLLMHPMIHYEKTIGLLGMFFRFFTSKEKICAFIFSAFLFFGLSKTIFHVEILGESYIHRELIINHLKDYQTPFFYLNDKNLYKKLNELNQDLNWVAIHQKGSKLTIHFLPRKKMELTQFHPYDLIASKEGVIAAFDVSKGNKMVSINQKVNQGDILVSHIIIDSSEQIKTSDVLGKVYAYTFQRVEIEISKNDFPISVNYYLCLMKSRMSLVLDENEYVVKEIPLQFEEDSDTIRMSNYYVLYEMISVIGESNE